MATRSTFVYSAAAVRRLMGLPASVPIQVQEFLNVLWVWVKGDRPTFISKTELKRHFVERRKADAQVLEVTDWLRTPGRYTVKNPVTGSHHDVMEYPDRLVCDCEDYHWQQQFIGRGCCKHGYAVLSHLGFDSLRSYVAASAKPKAAPVKVAAQAKPKAATAKVVLQAKPKATPVKPEPTQEPLQLTLSL